jgi:hypothetical protein
MTSSTNDLSNDYRREVEDLRQIEQSIRVAIDALVAAGDQLGARRLEIRLKARGQR